MNLFLKGIIPPMVTPLTNHGDLDLPGLHRLIEHILAGGVHGIFLLGTTGEGPSLSHLLRKHLISEACAIVDKRVPVLVCITDTSLSESLEIAEHAKGAGADFLVVASPYYFPITQDEMQHYLKMIAPLLPLPFLLYNMPSCTKTHLSLQTVKKAKTLGAIGIKDSSGDLTYLDSLLDEFRDDPEFSVFTGSESFIPEIITKGGDGAVAGGANFFPKLFVDFYEASLAKDKDKIVSLRIKINWINDKLYNIAKQESRYVRSTKSILSVMGICGDQTAAPLSPFTRAQRGEIKARIDEFLIGIEYRTT